MVQQREELVPLNLVSVCERVLVDKHKGEDTKNHRPVIYQYCETSLGPTLQYPSSLTVDLIYAW